jgi:thioesterase domain-containing protein
MNALDFQKHAESMFPVVPHMGLKVAKLNPSECVLTGLLAANKNHLGTAFGGSLYCFAALSCYGVVWSALAQHNMMTQDIVISEGNIKYHEPVKENFEVQCKVDDEMDLFLETLKNKKKARLKLKAEIRTPGKLCAVFEGTYVAFLRKDLK